jgi:hypothetical protein
MMTHCPMMANHVGMLNKEMTMAQIIWRELDVVKKDGGKLHRNMFDLDGALASLGEACKEHNPNAKHYDGTSRYILQSMVSLLLIQREMRAVDKAIEAYIASAETRLAHTFRSADGK